MFKCLYASLFLFFIVHFSGQGQNNGLTYATPDDITIDMDLVHKNVDSIMTLGIRNQAFPGAQLLVAKDNKIIFHKTYGYHTYDSIQPVSMTDMYDLASVTKITGPLPALMKLYEDGLLDLDAPFSLYWPSWKRQKDKKDITLRELLAHQSGLQPYIVFLGEAMKDGAFKKRFLRRSSNRRFSNMAYSNIYVKNRFKNKVFREIRKSEVSKEKKYRYSGLASLIYPQLIEDLTGTSYNSYLKKHFYDPLECYTLSYNPKLKTYRNIIVPTELDTFFRKSVVTGWVHDENAALLGGISGNAGLFGTAKDLAVYMQMLVQKGHYNGVRYFKPETVEEFISVQFPGNNNRRGLGFDKPLLGNDTLSLKEAYPAPEASPKSFGHSGFTGTFVWADPENQMVFIFLSNRVYPTRANRNLYNLNIRPALQQVFYKAFKNQL